MNRRSFLRNTSFVAGGMFISLHAKAFTVFEDNVVTGFVKDGGLGVADVVISDGFSVLKTDRKGFYTIKLDERATHLFISTPAGYEFLNRNNLVNQYENLNGQSTYNFNLKKLTKDDEKHFFIIWADPQVKNLEDVQQMMLESVPDTKAVIQEIGEKYPVHGICVGDIVWDNHSLFDRYNEAVKEMGIPFFQVLGNHDMDYRQGDDETSDKTFKEHYGPTYYSFNRGKVHYIVLDDVRYLGTERNYDGYIVEQQLEWLKKDLEFVPKEHLIVLSTHIPVSMGVKNKEDLYAILDGRNVHIMAGHTHFNGNSISENVYEHIHGTVCGAWWTGPVCGDGAPRGYAVYEANGNQLQWYYKSTGMPKEHQISIDVQELTDQKRIMANIWNWDPNWKVEYWTNDKYVGIMENAKGYDPQTVRLYSGAKMPVKRSFVEPIRTAHLFMAHVSPEIKSVKVQATDRFGNKFVQIAAT